MDRNEVGMTEFNRLNPDAIAANIQQGLQHPKLLPVNQWNPSLCGDSDMRIDWHGTWYYRDSPIQRPALVRLFSRVLRREGQGYVLVTPVEKLMIEVEDVPFIAVIMDNQLDDSIQHINLTTQTGDCCQLSTLTGWEIHTGQHDEEIPYVEIRDDLWARVHRNVFYQLIALGEEHIINNGQRLFGFWSDQCFFPLTKQPIEN
ncbi:DUF1285 domain-containing protein [Zooshikella harenae]|uniref:DUF1285 domain-containing protein n=1 Tax=Zooshikella harenae TaxID=2827238 RepID=A0ABS5ZGV6_9GAMM|nr:DUF1285 domain-containing protein [Zooshikella harenae]MBU2713234.1 DUF1285 domain-containing protein [Zooshikella harenae]